MFPAGTRLGVKLRTGNYRLAQERFHFAILPSSPLVFEGDLSHLFWGQASPGRTQAVRPRNRPTALLLQHWSECAFHGVGPDLIALLVRMQQVRHDVPGKRPVRSEEFGTDIHKLHHLPVIEKRELDIDLFEEHT